MQLKPYQDRLAAVVCGADMVVQVLLSRYADDIEFVMVRPYFEGYMDPTEFAARQLRDVGTIGLHGLSTRVIFNEPLEPQIVERIAEAFIAYTRVLIGDEFQKQFLLGEIAELERMFSLPDTRIN